MDLIDLRVARPGLHRSVVLCRLEINRVGRAGDGAQTAGHALLQAVLVAHQDLFSPVFRKNRHFLFGVIDGDRLPEDVLEGGRETDDERTDHGGIISREKRKGIREKGQGEKATRDKGQGTRRQAAREKGQGIRDKEKRRGPEQQEMPKRYNCRFPCRRPRKRSRPTVPADDARGQGGDRRGPVDDAGAVSVVPAHPAHREARLAGAADLRRQPGRAAHRWRRRPAAASTTTRQT